MIKNLHRWTRLSSIKWEDAWVERLRFLGPEHIAFVTWPDSRALKIEAFCEERTAKQLVKRFGGRSTKVAPQIWSGDPAKPRAPLAVRGKLKVFSDEESWRKNQKAARAVPGIFIPAGMAFGTGEHATTITCLRFLSDLSSTLPKDFSVLDLGTGSGILAIGAAALGAGQVEAIDYDPVAVRIARQNITKNRYPQIHAETGDVLKLATRKRYDVIVANLFSEVLIAASPRIAKSLKPRGWLIFSGVLRKQSREVSAVFQKCGFTAPRIISRGKWCAGICRLRS